MSFLFLFKTNFRFASLCTITLLLCLVASDGAKILFFSGLSTYSHRILVWPLVEQLVARGHQVTYLSAFPNREPNPNGVQDFVPSGLTKFYTGEGVMNVNLLHTRFQGKLVEKWGEMPEFGVLICKLILNSPDTQEWAQTAHFDLIFIDALLNDCAYAFVHKYKAKHIVLGTTTIFTWQYDPLGVTPETNWIPDFIHHFPAAENMTFLHRVFSTLENLRWHFVYKNNYIPQIEEIIRTDFEMDDFPPISEIQKNISLYFANTHFSEEYARAVPPFVIPVGGMHLRGNDTNRKIPKKLEEFVQGDNGFIYISFGTDARISTLPPQILQFIFNALEESKLPCIWRWDGKIPENTPDNVLMSKWLPQQALLAHPKIKMMITHGGLLSIHEAIHHKVPLLVIPIFAEQDFNAERVQRKGFGLKLEITSLTRQDLSSAISALLIDVTFKLRMEEVSKIFDDRMNTPLETAVWYTEYALRHDTSLMKPYSMHQTWYQRRLLDVWIFLFLATLVFFFFLFFIIKNIFKFIIKCCTNPPQESHAVKPKTS